MKTNIMFKSITNNILISSKKRVLSSLISKTSISFKILYSVPAKVRCQPNNF